MEESRAQEQAAGVARGLPLPKPGQDWRLPVRYQYRRLIGVGSYGSVCEAVDKNEAPEGGSATAARPRRVAIKRIQGVFDNLCDGKRILRELAILRQLRARGSAVRAVRLLDVIRPEDPDSFQELYLVLEYAGQDLRNLSRRRNVFLTEGRVRSMLRSILLGVQELHACGLASGF
eukprot:gnl/TRDRNA2_/TRDRNA2_97419_c2_seq2.p1 gnl/TRDRNA2_/TRDRNA2_97419_c2~~gnl/TRDRNA2_/TRDRNA2_97419_c2_seq2.p1  ORF type:complete len:175 (-),score=15.69 gnl/TRDRNA2_/TRDRNA2_97419_c2_seq2:56-580(-)